ILDSARFPMAPTIPNRPKVLVFGFLFGCLLGAVLSITRERLTPQFRGAEDVELVIGPQLLAAIPDFTFLWSPTKSQRYFPSAYLPGRRLGSIEDLNRDFTVPDRLENEATTSHGVDKRFVTKLFPRSM